MPLSSNSTWHTSILITSSRNSKRDECETHHKYHFPTFFYNFLLKKTKILSNCREETNSSWLRYKNRYLILFAILNILFNFKTDKLKFFMYFRCTIFHHFRFWFWFMMLLFRSIHLVTNKKKCLKKPEGKQRSSPIIYSPDTEKSFQILASFLVWWKIIFSSAFRTTLMH